VGSIGPVGKDVDAVPLRSRYAELLRLRGYVERLERLCHDDAERRKRSRLAPISERCERGDAAVPDQYFGAEPAKDQTAPRPGRDRRRSASARGRQTVFRSRYFGI
jgi:hypothetical protein